MKKLMAMFIAIAFLATVTLVGCGPSQEPPKPAPPPKEEAKPAPAPEKPAEQPAEKPPAPAPEKK